MRKLLVALIVLVVLVGGAGGLAYWYVSPSQPLDLAYEEVPLEHRAIQMIGRMSLDLELTQEDVDNLGKKQIAAQPEYQPGVLITGAKFRLEGGKLIADVNAKWRDRVPVGLTIVYRLNWQSPNLIAEVESAKLKDIELPAGAVGDVVIPLKNELPKLLKVKDVRIENDHVTVEFRRPSMQELGQLLG